MTTSLTERYISATIRSIAPDAEHDVRAELEASIADAIDARVENGEEPASAERAVLTELGDPGILAAGYADRPLHLIGPKYYLTWWRLLRLLLAIVPVTAVGGVIIGQSISGATVGEIVASAISTGLSVIVNLTFWVTLVFAILERTGTDTGVRWNVDQLPEPKQNGVGLGDTITSLVFLALLAGALLWDGAVGFVRPDNEPLPILNPELGPWVIGGLLALVAAEAALTIAVYLTGRWTTGLAIVNSVLAVLFVSLTVTLLARGELINPEFVSTVFSDNGVDAEAVRIIGLTTGFTIVGVAAWDVVDGWLKASRARRR